MHPFQFPEMVQHVFAAFSRGYYVWRILPCVRGSDFCAYCSRLQTATLSDPSSCFFYKKLSILLSPKPLNMKQIIPLLCLSIILSPTVFANGDPDSSKL